MKRAPLFVAAAALAILPVGCASYYKLPAEDVEALEKLGAADLPRFAEHYKELYDEQRPPTAEEFGYWRAKYEAVLFICDLLRGRVQLECLDRESMLKLLASILGKAL